MRGALLLLAFSGCHTALRPQKIGVDCGEEIPGIELVAQSPLVMLGEMHGIVGPPEFAVDLACRLALLRSQAVLALEISKEEQARIDAFLASEGSASDRARLLSGTFWNKPMQDGRASRARLEMFEHARRLIHAGLRLRLVGISDGGAAREKVMADALVTLVQQKRGPVIMLVGNSHVRTTPDPDEPNVLRMGVMVHQQVPNAMSLDNRYSAGDAWVCTLDAKGAVQCGRQPLEDSGPGLRWRITLFAAPDEAGVHGTYDVGAAHASEPARSANQQR